MRLDKLTDVVLHESCRYHQLQEQEHSHKKHEIKQAVLNIILHRGSYTLSFDEDTSIVIKHQRVNKIIEKDDMVYLCVEYGFQNIRIYNIRLTETITLSEFLAVVKQK